MLEQYQIDARDRKTKLINDLSQELGFTATWLSYYCCRINGYLDIWIKNQRWHCIKNNTRGCTGHLETFFRNNIQTIKEYGVKFPHKD